MNQKISSLVKYQFPEFVRENHSKFIEFVEAYYKFLEQDQGAFEIVQNAKSYIDIDTTTAGFVQYFLNTYARNIPTSALSDKPLLIKNIKDLYESKGSAISFKMLFRILFNDSIEVDYPYENVLIPSNSDWSQQISLFLERISGDPSEITSHSASITKNGIKYEFTVNRVKQSPTGLYQIYIDWKNNIIPFAVDDIVSVRDKDGVIFSGRIAPTTVDFEILYNANGFKEGMTFFIPGGTILKIREIDSNGGIVSIEFVEFGSNYPEDFFVELSKNGRIAIRPSLFLSKTLGFVDTLTIYRIPDGDDLLAYIESGYTDADYVLGVEYHYYAEEYVLNNKYTAEDFYTFEDEETYSVADSTSVSPGNSETVSIVKIMLGAVAKYKGQFTTNKGFLSENNVRLQDDKLYQPYAYQIQTKVDISKFYNVVKKLIHPAGTNMFSNRILSSTIDISDGLNVTTTSSTISI